jgi:hypothetical protein
MELVIRLPPNWDLLSEEDKRRFEEWGYRRMLRASLGRCSDDPLLRSGGKVERFYGSKEDRGDDSDG